MRQALDQQNGRIKSMEAPVVPMTDARMVPINSTIVLTAGVPCNVPLT